MKYIKSFVLVSALSLVSFASFAQSVTATGSTLDDAQAQIAAQAKQLVRLTTSPKPMPVIRCT